MFDENVAWIWLSYLKRVNNNKKIKILNYFKNISTLFEASKNDLTGIGELSEVDIKNILDKKNKEFSYKIYEEVKSKKNSILKYFDKFYPEDLKNIYDPPVCLFYKGNINLTGNVIAVVGARKASQYGKEVTRKLVQDLVKHNFTIVSGMARGIDTIAHKETVSSNGKTIAVLGCGLDIIYPPENGDLMEKIQERGLVLTEFLPGVAPLGRNFPIRNRIISGLSKGVLIVEANEKSGSLITADCALDQNRDVFAVPGNIFNTTSAGTNKLIKYGAKIVTCVNDILEEYNGCMVIEDADNNKYCELNSEQRLIIDILKLNQSSIDDIHRETNINIKDLNCLLMNLEIEGFVQRIPGQRYTLVN